MNTQQQALYDALRARDRKFDGRFFVGVSSTGIYCRPVCSARTPKLENCTFYPSAAAAELAGFRPCLKCRPELAPGLALIDLGNRYAQVAVQLIEQGYLSEHSCEALAARLGISDRHLRRIFAEQFGASPIDFGSLRRFNELFKARYRLIPSALRSGGARGERAAASGLVFHLGYRPPYDWDRMLNFLQARAVQGVERVEGRRYLRSIAVNQGGTEYRGWVSVQPEEARNRVRVEIAPALSLVTTEVLRRVRLLFDLDAAPDRINEALGLLAADAPGLRLPGCVNSFEQAARAVLGQLVSVKMAATFAGRMAERWGEPLAAPHEGITHVFPSAERVAQLQPEALRLLGVQLKRAAALIEIARALGEGRLQLDNVLDIDQGIRALTALPGIGNWTASYIAMRAWSWPDVFLAGDYLIKQRFPGMTPRQIERYAERWRPWRSYATLHLWHNDGWAPEGED